MATPPFDERHLKSLIRSVLHEDGVLKRDDSQETLDNPLHPVPTPADDPFTKTWYASLIPQRVREPFKSPDSKPVFFHVRDAQHAALFNPLSATGGSPEADLLYQSIAFLHRAMDDFLPLIEGQQHLDVWKSLKGVSEMLQTRYDLLCALRRSRDDEHIRYLEMFMQPPLGDGAAAARVHREICRAVGRKRPRNEARVEDQPMSARKKIDRKDGDDDVEMVTPTKTKLVRSKTTGKKDMKTVNRDVKAVSKDAKAVRKDAKTVDKDAKVAFKEKKAVSKVAAKEKSSASGSPVKKAQTPRSPKAKPSSSSPKTKRSAPTKINTGPVVSRTRSGDVTNRLRSATPAKNKSSGTGMPVVESISSPRARKATPVKKSTSAKPLSVSKSASAIKKKTTASNATAVVAKSETPKKKASVKVKPKTGSTSAKPSDEERKPQTAEEPTMKEKVWSVQSSEEEKVQSKVGEAKRPQEVAAPAAQVNGTRADHRTAVVEGEDLDITEVPLSKKQEPKVERGRLSVRRLLETDKRVAASDASLGPKMTHSTFVIRGNSDQVATVPLEEYAGLQWRVVAYPKGDKHDKWMSVYIECQGPSPRDGSGSGKEQSQSDVVDSGESKSDQAWFVQVKFSVRVLRSGSGVAQAVVEGGKVAFQYDPELLGESIVTRDRKVARAGLLSDYVGSTSHRFSPSTRRAGFEQLAPTSCLNSAMYTDKDKNIVLILFMCAE